LMVRLRPALKILPKVYTSPLVAVPVFPRLGWLLRGGQHGCVPRCRLARLLTQLLEIWPVLARI